VATRSLLRLPMVPRGLDPKVERYLQDLQRAIIENDRYILRREQDWPAAHALRLRDGEGNIYLLEQTKHYIKDYSISTPESTITFPGFFKEGHLVMAVFFHVLETIVGPHGVIIDTAPFPFAWTREAFTNLTKGARTKPGNFWNRNVAYFFDEQGANDLRVRFVDGANVAQNATAGSFRLVYRYMDFEGGAGDQRVYDLVGNDGNLV
jgi:hypothetical protein